MTRSSFDWIAHLLVLPSLGILFPIIKFSSFSKHVQGVNYTIDLSDLCINKSCSDCLIRLNEYNEVILFIVECDVRRIG